MTDDYKRLRTQADRLAHHFHDMLDDKIGGSAAYAEARNIVEVFEMNKEPRSIEDRIKTLQQRLRNLDNQTPQVMDGSDLDRLIDGYEDLREELRDLDNY